MKSDVTTPPKSQGETKLACGHALAPAVVEAVLGAALNAYKAGTLAELLRRRPRLTRRFEQQLLRPIRLAAGDALDRTGVAAPWELLLRWAVTRLRPDGQASLQDIPRECWIERTSWRPMLAVMCQYGFAAVPDFRDRYRARADESASDHLCGLWSVGPSTFYRYLDKGKRLMAEVLLQPPSDGRGQLGLWRLVQQSVYERLGLEQPEQRAEWHRLQATRALLAREPAAAVWHLLAAGDIDQILATLERRRIELANDVATDTLLEALQGQPMVQMQQFRLALAVAALWHVRGDDDREQQAYERTLRLAGDDPLRLGIVYGALGKFHEPRDPDRAFSCYQDSAEFLRRAGLQDNPAEADAPLLAEYVNTLVKLAWIYVLRNDPRAKPVLDQAEDLRAMRALPSEVQALLEQAWGEYWRRAGDLRAALEHKHRALNLYERMGDQQSVLKTYSNLSLLYGDAKDFARAIEYSQRVLALEGQVAIEPETLAATHMNLGATYFWQGRYDQAIEHYRSALERSAAAKLRLLMGRAHYNLAEAYYKRFQALERPEDEQRGDAHAAAALALWPQDADAGAIEATRGLKREILGPRDNDSYDRLLPQEFAVHFHEMAEVQRQRAVLALPLEPQVHVKAHIAIARSYLTISTKEREAALALIHKHQLGDAFADEFDGLRAVFNRELTREQRVTAHWRQATSDLLPDERRAALLDRLVRGEPISKSIYAELCSVGLATASKHLGLLAERGLLVQVGKGPATRYLLPTE